MLHFQGELVERSLTSLVAAPPALPQPSASSRRRPGRAPPRLPSADPQRLGRAADDQGYLPRTSDAPVRKLLQRAAADFLIGLGELGETAPRRSGPRRPPSQTASRRPGGASKKIMVRGSVASWPSRRARSAALRGRKPSKQKRSTGRPEMANAVAPRTDQHRGDPEPACHCGRDEAIARVGYRRHP